MRNCVNGLNFECSTSFALLGISSFHFVIIWRYAFTHHGVDLGRHAASTFYLLSGGSGACPSYRGCFANW